MLRERPILLLAETIDTLQDLCNAIVPASNKIGRSRNIHSCA
jgi:hypothetical protein